MWVISGSSRKVLVQGTQEDGVIDRNGRLVTEPLMKARVALQTELDDSANDMHSESFWHLPDASYFGLDF